MDQVEPSYSIPYFNLFNWYSLISYLMTVRILAKKILLNSCIFFLYLNGYHKNIVKWRMEPNGDNMFCQFE